MRHGVAGAAVAAAVAAAAAAVAATASVVIQLCHRDGCWKGCIY